MIDQIVGRCHVGESYVSVIKYVVSRFRAGEWRKLTRKERRRIMRRAMRIHRRNRELYASVMRGGV